MPICVLVADSGKARVLLAESGRDPLIDYMDFAHPESRLREQDLVTDGAGSATETGSHGKHSIGNEKSAHRKHAEAFARELCGELDKLRRKRNLRRIYLVAAPKLLGHLRARISDQSAELLAGEIDKDLVEQSIENIRAHLPKIL